MAITATTLSGAINANQTSFGVASASGITNPVYPTGSGFTYLFVDNELMFVTNVTGTVVSVLRGQGGTSAVAHASACPVLIGLPSDFASFIPAIAAFTAKASVNDGWSAPVVGAATITASGRRFHLITTTTQCTVMHPPTPFVEGVVTVAYDVVQTWTTGGGTNGFAVAGTPTTAGSTVDFTYDAATALWYPSRLA